MVYLAFYLPNVQGKIIALHYGDIQIEEKSTKSGSTQHTQSGSSRSTQNTEHMQRTLEKTYFFWQQRHQKTLLCKAEYCGIVALTIGLSYPHIAHLTFLERPNNNNKNDQHGLNMPRLELAFFLPLKPEMMQDKMT